MGRRTRKLMSPEVVHTAAGLGLALLGAAGGLRLFHLTWTWYHFLACWLVAINLTAFAYYGWDKSRARSSGRRVPEVVLHLLALAGGTVGAYAGMRCFRHKTIKGSFRFAFWCIVALQVVFCAWFISHKWGHNKG